MRVTPNTDTAENIQTARSEPAPLAGRIRPLLAHGQGMFDGGCSSEPAKPTLEKTFEQLSSLQKLLLARQLGYDSFDNMLDASKVVTLSDGSAWWLTADRYGAWAAWNLCKIDFARCDRISDETRIRRKKPR